MEKQTKTLEVLTTEVAAYLKKLSYSDSRIKQYQSAWQRVAEFMENDVQQYYNARIGEGFIYFLIGNRKYDDLSRWEKDIIMCTNILTEFLETGSYKFKRSKKFRELLGPVGQTMQEYIMLRKSYGISQITEDEYRYHFQHFLSFLSDNEICSVSSINQQTIINYVNQLGFCTSNVRHRKLSVLKRYLRYLYDNEFTVNDCSRMVPKDRYIKQPKLPSTYTKEEVEAMISAIDRGNPKGKRDYAMVLITARLGLRATDVCDLSFENLCWNKSLIVLNQQKTGELIELPLLTEVGEAIIDYLKYGRPKSELQYIFLHVVSPYDRLNRSTLHSIVCLYLQMAGIQYAEKRKHGPHALRHCLAGVLLENKVPIPVISEVLGHKNTESTRYYLKIDINALRQCTLEVPKVPYSFYEGGIKNE